MVSLISIIVPIFNVEKYLNKCVESILSQTYTNLEIFLVDDGSPDNCRNLCDEYAAKDSRIKVIHKSNGGLSDARNMAIDQMEGKYVVFIDSDDYVSPTHIEGLYKLIEKHQADVAVNTFCSFFEGTIPEPKSKTKEYVFSGIEAVEKMFYQELFDNSAWGKMYRSSFFEGIRYPKGLLYEDLPTTYRLLLKANKVAYNYNESYFYLIRKDSIEGSTFSPAKLDSALQLMLMMDKDIDKIQPIIKSYHCRIVSFIFHMLLQMPDEYANKDQFIQRIKDYRWEVLTDRCARKKARVACFISYMGFRLLNKIFIFIDKRK